MHQTLKQEITSMLQENIAALYPHIKNVRLEIPKVASFGDYASNAALQSGQNPMQAGEAIQQSLTRSTKDMFAVSLAKPGFVNMRIHDTYLAHWVFSHIGAPLTAKGPTQSILIEHTSANPNKAMHIGHLRNMSIGDVVNRILRRLGRNVIVQLYSDDTGVQVASLILGLTTLKIPYDKKQSFDTYASDIYVKIHQLIEEDPQLQEQRDQILHALEDQNSSIFQNASIITDLITKCHLATAEQFNVSYDEIVKESDILHKHVWDKTFALLKEKNKIHFETGGEHKGCWVIGDKVMVRSNGIPVYTAKDLAYQLLHFGIIKEKGFRTVDSVINVIDTRQSYPQQVIKDSLFSLGYTKEAEHFHHLSYNFVSLSANALKQLTGRLPDEEHKAFAMSGRKGIEVRINDLLEVMTEKTKNQEIAAGALKFFMLSFDKNTEIVFDFDKATAITGMTGPYLQYSYARALRMLDKITENTTFDTIGTILQNYTIQESERKLLFLLSQFYDILLDAEAGLEPFILADYAFQLASAFSSFYQTLPVLQAEKNARAFRILLTKAYITYFGDVLDTLGITKIEKM